MVTLLRTLTLKSRLKFGKYADYTVDYLLYNHREDYLVWVYYNTDKITFTADLLTKLDIREDERIEKPGKNKKMGWIVAQRQDATLSSEVREIRSQIKRSEATSKLEAMDNDGRFSTAGLTRRNQGHR